MHRKRNYRVVGTITISVSTVVRAKSADEARKLAADLPIMTLCHQCAGESDRGQWVTPGELDGEVEMDTAEPEDL